MDFVCGMVKEYWGVVVVGDVLVERKVENGFIKKKYYYFE